jgi:hypothetical protein
MPPRHARALSAVEQPIALAHTSKARTHPVWRAIKSLFVHMEAEDVDYALPSRATTSASAVSTWSPSTEHTSGVSGLPSESGVMPFAVPSAAPLSA